MQKLIWLLSVVVLCELDTVQSQQAVRFPPQGATMTGNQFGYDTGFDLTDWNGDGQLDILIPTGGMTSFMIYLNDGTKIEPVFRHGLMYDYNNTETVPQTIEHQQSWAIGDLNGDGLLDLIYFDGQLRMILNTGTAHGPNHWNLLLPAPNFFPGSAQMIKDNSRFSTGPESFFWNKGIFARQVLTLSVADWNGDGLNDLLICRFKEEAPGVKSVGGGNLWTTQGRVATGVASPPPSGEPSYQGRLSEAPARGLYFYKNVGSREKPQFDAGVEITTPDGKSISAPNPVMADLDGDGVVDIISTETEYSCNAYRVDWPTAPSVIWYRGIGGGDSSKVESAKPVLDAGGKPIPAGVQARVVDFRGVSVKDLLVMDSGLKGTIRWYPNSAQSAVSRSSFGAPTILRGTDFPRFDFMFQPLIANWFGRNSRDLILHGCTDAHCKMALRRTTLYRNVAKNQGELQFEIVGQLNYRGDREMVPRTMEATPYEAYGSAVGFPEDGTGGKKLFMSVGGRLYMFSKLAADGLTFQERKEIELPAERNYYRGLQEMDVKVTDKVQYIRISNNPDLAGSMFPKEFGIVKFEAIGGGKNWATTDAGATVIDQSKIDSPYYKVHNPKAMISSNPDRTQTIGGGMIGPITVVLKEPVALDEIRFEFGEDTNRQGWYVPFFWQGKLFSRFAEKGEAFYQYKVEVSNTHPVSVPLDQQKWTTVANHLSTEMYRSFPNMVDWDGDEKLDLVLGVLDVTDQFDKSKGSYARVVEYRLYRNIGSNDDPKFDQYQSFLDENGKPIRVPGHPVGYGNQACVFVSDFDGDGKPDLMVEDPVDLWLLQYQNISSDPKKELKFKYLKHVGDPRPLLYNGGYLYFYCGDVDGDGIPDIINSLAMVFFKGCAASAPERVDLLTVVKTGQDSVEVQWKRPRGTAQFDLRWSSEEEINEMNWGRLAGLTAAYTAAEGEWQSARLTRLPAGKTVFLAVKSLNKKEELSPLSDVTQSVIPPLKEIVLRNGAQGGEGVPAYSGNETCWLDGSQPKSVTPRNTSGLYILGNAEKPKVVLVRFKDLPKLPSLENATLEFTSDVSVQQNRTVLQVIEYRLPSCYAIRDDWDVARATFAEAALGKPWDANELTRGGTFVSMLQPNFTVGERKKFRFDVTEAVRAAQKEGKTAISLLLRVDCTGRTNNSNYDGLCGSQFPIEELRPKLRLVVK